MAPGPLIILGVALPIGLYLLLAIWGPRPIAGMALPLTLAACAACLIMVWQVLALNPETFLSLQAAGSAYNDSYYILVNVDFIKDFGILYGLVALATRFMGNTGGATVQAGMPWATLGFHLGSSAYLLAPLLARPARYIDYATAFNLAKRFSHLGSTLVVLSLTLLGVLVIATRIRFLISPPRKP